MKNNVIDTECGLGGRIYWRDLAIQLAQVWWEVTEVGGNLQHGDLDKDISFSIVLPKHGGKVFHGDTPRDVWSKAKKWLMSPDRTFEALSSAPKMTSVVKDTKDARELFPEKDIKAAKISNYHPVNDPTNGYIPGMSGLRDLESGRELYPDI